MNIALWILQVLLALAFMAHGVMMVAPSPEIAAQMNSEMPRWFQLFIGIAEVLAAVGLVLPGITRIMPGLVPAAAAGIMVVMVSATIFHISRGERGGAATTFVLLLIATFVAYGRWRHPIAPRRGAAMS